MKITEIRFATKTSFPEQEQITYLRSGVHPGKTKLNEMHLLKEGVLVRYKMTDTGWKNYFVPFQNIASLILEGEVPLVSLFEEEEVPSAEVKKAKNAK